MSVTKSKFSDIRTVDYLTGINTAAIIYIYYSMTTLGQDLNNKIIRLTTVLKRLNKNINVSDMQLKRFIFESSINPLHDDKLNEEDIDSNAKEEDFKIEVLERIKALESRLSIYESVNNPIIPKCTKINKNESPNIVHNHDGGKTAVIW